MYFLSECYTFGYNDLNGWKVSLNLVMDSVVIFTTFHVQLATRGISDRSDKHIINWSTMHYDFIRRAEATLLLSAKAMLWRQICYPVFPLSPSWLIFQCHIQLVIARWLEIHKNLSIPVCSLDDVCSKLRYVTYRRKMWTESRATIGHYSFGRVSTTSFVERSTKKLNRIM